MTVETRLTGHALFQAFTPDEIRRLSSFSSVKPFGRDEVVYHHEQAVSHVFVLLKGAVQLQIPASVREMPLRIARVGDGELFGVAPLIGMDRYSATARAIEPSEVLTVELRPFRGLLEENPRAAAAIFRKVAQSYHSRYLELLLSLQGLVSKLPL